MTPNSYDAVIGMLKWVLPLDYERTLNVLAQSLYKRVTLDKVAIAQTPTLVEFRTRINQTTVMKNLYPFDDLHFIDSSGKDAKSNKFFGANEAKQKRSDLLSSLKLTQHQAPHQSKNHMKTSVVQSYSVQFFEETTLQMVKIFFSQTPGLFSLAVQIEDKLD